MTEGLQMHRWAHDLWPINRSLTGPGVRETLRYIRELLPPLQIHSVATDTTVHDWTIPHEWVCHEAYIITPDGRRICDYSVNNLHLVGYSIAVDTTLSLEQLMPFLHTLPDYPHAIPYVTSYYKKTWGFCLSHHEFEELVEGDYRIIIDSVHYEGDLNYADMIIEGHCEKEIMLSTYVCHPSMANNEISGPVMVTALARWLLENRDSLRYSYRITFTPETIGAITYLHQHHHEMGNIVAGYQVTCVGDERTYSCVTSPYADTVSDKIALETLAEFDPDFKHYSFLQRGSDERQWCAPHVRLPIASICRSKYGEFPEYHTSADTLEDVVTPGGLQGAFDAYRRCIERFESMDIDEIIPGARERKDGAPVVNCIGEPQLGKRGLYNNLSHRDGYADIRDIINVITYCDGTNSCDDIAALTGIDSDACSQLLETLSGHGLIDCHCE